MICLKLGFGIARNEFDAEELLGGCEECQTIIERIIDYYRTKFPRPLFWKNKFKTAFECGYIRAPNLEQQYCLSSESQTIEQECRREL